MITKNFFVPDPENDLSHWASSLSKELNSFTSSIIKDVREGKGAFKVYSQEPLVEDIEDGQIAFAEVAGELRMYTRFGDFLFYLTLIKVL